MPVFFFNNYSVTPDLSSRPEVFMTLSYYLNLENYQGGVCQVLFDTGAGWNKVLKFLNLNTL
jgi:hypothetical protein